MKSIPFSQMRIPLKVCWNTDLAENFGDGAFQFGSRIRGFHRDRRRCALRFGESAQYAQPVESRLNKLQQYHVQPQ